MILTRASWRMMPGGPESFDLLVDDFDGDSPALRQRCHACHRAVEVTEVSGPARFRRSRKSQEPLSRLSAEGDMTSRPARVLFQLVLQIGFDILNAVAQARQAKRPEVYPGEKVFAE